MTCRLYELFSNEQYVNLIKNRLPEIFYIAEIECSRAGKVGMEVGSVRESILISLLMFTFGECEINVNIPIAESEIDVILSGIPVSIKTKTGRGFTGIKAVWTVDPIKVRDYIEHFKPHYDILIAQMDWNQTGGLFYLPVEAQIDVFNWIGIDKYLIAPKAGTNPRGVEYNPLALEEILRDSRSRTLPILWNKPNKSYNKYDRWLDFWKEE